MTHVAHSSFVIDRKDAQPVEWQGGNMGHNTFHKTFTGDLIGTSVVKAIILVTELSGPAVYVGIERFECAVNGQQGTFLLTHTAFMPDPEHITRWQVVPGSGTGGLEGISGFGEIQPGHNFRLEYRLDSDGTGHAADGTGQASDGAGVATEAVNDADRL